VRRGGVAVLLLALGNQVRWARRTRPEALPSVQHGTYVAAPDGALLFAELGGDPEASLTVVLVHGLLARSLEFEMQWQSLGSRARLLRYDHRNHGRSELVAGGTDIAALADDLAAVVSQLAPEGDLVLVGHSMGGMTVLSLAERHPELLTRVRGVALVATGAGHLIDGHRLEDGIRLIARRRGLAPALLLLRLAAPVLEQLRPRRTHLVRWAVKRLVFGTDDVDPALLTQTQALLEEPPLAALAALQRSVLRNDTRLGLENVAGRPVVIISGSEDKLTRPEHSRRMAEATGAQLLVLPGAGHVVNQTRATEVNAALHQLLDAVAAERVPTTVTP
jgi:pimeloyl-ACP methyl ester carboxylesterase